MYRCHCYRPDVIAFFEAWQLWRSNKQGGRAILGRIFAFATILNPIMSLLTVLALGIDFVPDWAGFITTGLNAISGILGTLTLVMADTKADVEKRRANTDNLWFNFSLFCCAASSIALVTHTLMIQKQMTLRGCRRTSRPSTSPSARLD